MSFSDMKMSGWMFEGLRNIRLREENTKAATQGRSKLTQVVSGAEILDLVLGVGQETLLSRSPGVKTVFTTPHSHPEQQESPSCHQGARSDEMKTTHSECVRQEAAVLEFRTDALPEAAHLSSRLILSREPCLPFLHANSSK